MHSFLNWSELPWLRRFTPSFLHPEFTWRHVRLGDVPLSSKLPSSPRPLPQLIRRAIGYGHDVLSEFARYYCAWYGISYRPVMVSLPFGLVLKWSDGTSVDEVQSMRAIRKAGIPAPRVISYGEHASTPWAPISILMTRIPGDELAEVYEDLEPDELDQIVSELHVIFKTMRSWPNPWGSRICSISGGSMRSIRVPRHRIGPYETEQELNDHLLSPASSHSFGSREDFERTLEVARQMQGMCHPTVFTHGDFALHNVMVHDGHVSAFIDWESAGWYPDYWEFTTPLRWSVSRPEWRRMLMHLGGSAYEKELEYEMAIKSLTVDSWIC
ncbi:APH-domain-containing protein [Xylariomycetidae sp. FL2044]|nr:APH-domain-containing protein [Xylariomycetidae sp. FL2044]